MKNEFNLDLNKAKYFAGHSLGEYSALSCAGYLDFSETLKILRIRGDAILSARACLKFFVMCVGASSNALLFQTHCDCTV